VQVVLLALEHRRLPAEPVGAGPLVLERRGGDRQHRDGAHRLHPTQGVDDDDAGGGDADAGGADAGGGGGEGGDQTLLQVFPSRVSTI